MFATRARWSTTVLFLASLAFAVLTYVAMRLYPDYRFTHHFFSDLGAWRTWGGLANHEAAVVFAAAVVILGAAMIVFAAAWRDYAFDRQRARGLGVASQICGTLSGMCFIGVAFAPVDVALDLHNALVVAAFGMLLAFAACTTILWAKNGAPLGVIVAGVVYAVMLVAFFIASGWAIATDLFKHIRVLIIGQKITVYASLAYVAFLTLTIRRRT